MKALTLTQPWASLVMAGIKHNETRGWSTPYRGLLAVHAGKGWTLDDQDFAADWIHAGRLPDRWVTTPRTNRPDLPLGAVLGVVELMAVWPTRGLVVQPLEAELGDYSPGRFAWRLRVIEVFAEPISARGALGLWEWTA